MLRARFNYLGRDSLQAKILITIFVFLFEREKKLLNQENIFFLLSRTVYVKPDLISNLFLNANIIIPTDEFSTEINLQQTIAENSDDAHCI